MARAKDAARLALDAAKQKAAEARRALKKAKKKTERKAERVKKEKDLRSYSIYLRGTGPTDPNRPIHIQAENLVEVVKYALGQYGKDRLLEVHDFRGLMVWGINTGINKENYTG
jgi:hypothetical protein